MCTYTYICVERERAERLLRRPSNKDRLHYCYSTGTTVGRRKKPRPVETSSKATRAALGSAKEAVKTARRPDEGSSYLYCMRFLERSTTHTRYSTASTSSTRRFLHRCYDASVSGYRSRCCYRIETARKRVFLSANRSAALFSLLF